MGSLLKAHQVFSFFWWLFLALNLTSGGSFELTFISFEGGSIVLWTLYFLSQDSPGSAWSFRPLPCTSKKGTLASFHGGWMESQHLLSVTWICHYLCACHCSCFKIFNLSANFLAFPLSIFVSTVSDGVSTLSFQSSVLYRFLNWLTYFSKYNQSQPPVASSPWGPCIFPMLLPLPHHHHSPLLHTALLYCGTQEGEGKEPYLKTFPKWLFVC